MNMRVPTKSMVQMIADAAVKSERNEAQAFHGRRVEERQRVNGQDNGYTGPVTEAELQAMKAAPSKTYKPAHGGYCLSSLTRSGNPVTSAYEYERRDSASEYERRDF